jgi:hypothetical protein
VKVPAPSAATSGAFSVAVAAALAAALLAAAAQSLLRRLGRPREGELGAGVVAGPAT